jgi:hypothetical protein
MEVWNTAERGNVSLVSAQIHGAGITSIKNSSTITPPSHRGEDACPLSVGYVSEKSVTPNGEKHANVARQPPRGYGHGVRGYDAKMCSGSRTNVDREACSGVIPSDQTPFSDLINGEQTYSTSENPVQISVASEGSLR